MKKLLLTELRPNQTITMLTDEAGEGFRYDFVIKKAGELPVGLLTQTNPAGEKVGPGEAVLLGSGHWTAAVQNPMMRVDWFIGRPYQERALAIGWGLLSVANYAVVRDPNEHENNFYQLQPPLADILVDEAHS